MESGSSKRDLGARIEAIRARKESEEREERERRAATEAHERTAASERTRAADEVRSVAAKFVRVVAPDFPGADRVHLITLHSGVWPVLNKGLGPPIMEPTLAGRMRRGWHNAKARASATHERGWTISFGSMSVFLCTDGRLLAGPGQADVGAPASDDLLAAGAGAILDRLAAILEAERIDWPAD